MTGTPASRRLARRRPAPALGRVAARDAARPAAGTAAFLFLLVSLTAQAQTSLVVSANADHLPEGNGGGVSALYIHPRAYAGATFFSLPDTRWAYATFGAMRNIDPRTLLTAEANLGRGTDTSGGFRYLLVRGGITHELLAKQLYGEAEWLQADVARRQNGIARIGATFVDAPLTLRGSLYQSITGDDDTTLVTVRGDYAFARMTAIAGFSAGRATPVLLQQSDRETTRVREAFGGVALRGWTIVATVGEDRQRVSVSWRIPMGEP
jgi:hypothetical protein